MKVFISHSSHDRWVAKQLSALLTGAGALTFLDAKDMESGDSIDHTIQAHLKDADDLLVLLTPYSLKSPWVFIEIGGAIALGKRIVPLLMHVESNEIPQPISKHLARSINEVDRYLEEIRLRSSKPSSSQAPATQFPRRPPPKFTRDGFRVGDRVRIVDVKLLTETDKMRAPKWTPPMNAFSETETVVSEILWEGHDDNEILVKLEIDDGRFGWATRWLRKAA